MSRHEHFEELAALAALGELNQSQVLELSLHMSACARCKQISDEYKVLHIAREALCAGVGILVESRRESVKATFLEKVAASALLDAKHPADSSDMAPQWMNFHPLWSRLGMAVLICFVFWLGSNYERHILGASKRPLVTIPAPIIQSTTPLDPQEKPAVAPPPVGDAKNNQLEDDLRTEKQRSLKLGSALNAREQELLASEQKQLTLQQQLDAKTEESRRTQSLLAAKVEESNQMQAAKTNDMNMMVALRYQIQDLTEKTNDQKQNLDRERELLASGRDIRDIIGARNLHIIDVYDTDSDGNTKKSFARAFYTEGKSLIFYAYDLPAQKSSDSGKFVYAAWGERNGNKKKVQNLGILLNDDKGQKRWVLNFSDPQVLGEIDSVFITLERVGTDVNGPNGKRILTAYLESQINHP